MDNILFVYVYVQTLPDATPPIGKIHPFSKITFKPKKQFRFLGGFMQP